MNRVAGKRGKLPAQRLASAKFLSEYAKSPLPTAPSAFDRASDVADYPMALNDTYGDCTIAGVVHLLQLAYAEVGEVFAYPGDPAVKTTYFDLTGGTDTGCVEASVLQKWYNDGLFGEKIIGTAPVNFRKMSEVRDALYAFGALYIGLEMPPDADERFENHEPWDVDRPPEAPNGGHCVVVTGANNLGLDVVTWGALESMTWKFWRTYVTEAYVVIPQVYAEVDHGPLASIDIAQLQADLTSV